MQDPVGALRKLGFGCCCSACCVSGGRLLASPRRQEGRLGQGRWPLLHLVPTTELSEAGRAS